MNAPAPAAPHPRRWQILGVLCLSLLAVTVDNTILNVAIPSLLTDLHATTSDVQWTIDAYSLVFAGLLLTAGGLGDRYGRRRAMLIGFALFGGGSLLGAFAASPGELIATRAVMGLGGAFLMPGTLSIMAQVFGPDERAKAFGIWGAASMIGVAGGPALGGLLLEHFWWGSVFLVNVPVSAAAVIGLLVLVPESRGPRRRPDVLGSVLSTIGTASLVWAIISAPDHGWTGARTLTGLAAGAAALTAFVLWQRRNPEPMLDLALLRQRAFSGSAAIIAILGFVLAGTLFALTQMLQLVLGYGPLKAGLALLPVAVAAAAGNGLGAALEPRLGGRLTLVGGLAAIAAGFGALALVGPGDGFASIITGIVVIGFGMGAASPPAYNILMTAVPAEEAGVGSAVNDAGQEVGNALGVAVLGSVVSAVYAGGLPDGAPAAAKHSLGEALALADPALAHQARDAFVHAVSAGSLAGCGATLAAAAFAAIVLRGTGRPTADPAADAADAADANVTEPA